MYEVEFTPQGSDDLGRLDKSVAQRMLKRIRWLAENFEALAPEALTGQWRGVYKLRIGDYRALYTFGEGQMWTLVARLEQKRLRASTLADARLASGGAPGSTRGEDPRGMERSHRGSGGPEDRPSA